MNKSSSKFASRRPVGLSLDVTPSAHDGDDYMDSLHSFKEAIKSVRFHDPAFRRAQLASGDTTQDHASDRQQQRGDQKTPSSASAYSGHLAAPTDTSAAATAGTAAPKHPAHAVQTSYASGSGTDSRVYADDSEYVAHDISNAHMRTAGFTPHDLDSIEADNAHFVSTVEELVPAVKEVNLQDVEIVVKLGTGCSSVVYLARHLVTGQLYALKLINLFDRSVRGMLFAELKALFSVDCEALISFYGVSLLEGQVACILEFMNLGGLDTVLRRIPSKSLPEKQLACVAQQVLWGLGYLSHERRVHRDVKPQNILVNSKGEVKLTDFGLSRLLETAMLANTFVGSFRYMSPERVLHEPYGAAADVWSLGMVLLEAAMGRYPYDEADSGSQVAMLMTLSEGHPPVIPEDIKKTFSPEFIHFVSCCLQRDPDQRWTAVALLQHDWLINQGAVNIEASAKVLEHWFEENGISDVFASEEL